MTQKSRLKEGTVLQLPSRMLPDGDVFTLAIVQETQWNGIIVKRACAPAGKKYTRFVEKFIKYPLDPDIKIIRE